MQPIAEDTNATFLAWLATASAEERSEALHKLIAELPAEGKLTLSAIGDDRPILDDVELRGVRLISAELAGARLRRADLRRADLTGAILRGADLGSARLGRANLTRADFDHAEMAAADLSGANLGKANLGKALCEEAQFVRAKLRFADLRGTACEQATFTRADLWGADLTNADCGRCDFRHAIFKESTAHDAAFVGADFRGADLTRASFVGADLSGADLRNARVNGADFRNVNLRHARLDGLDLTTVVLDGVHLSGARLDGTRLDWQQIGDRLGEETAGNVEAARGGYLALEQLFTALGDMAAASWAYRRRRRMQKRLAWRMAKQQWREQRIWKALRSAGTAVGDQLVEWGCDYGESIGRVFLTLTTVFIVFAIVYGVTESVVLVERGPDGADIRRVVTDPSDMAVFSLLALTTSGSPVVGLQPRDQFVHFLTGVQALLGIGLTGLMGFVAGNRVRR